MNDNMSELNERLTASCRETLQQLDDIETKLAGLHEAIARSSGPRIASAVTAITSLRPIMA
jgi:hypothetical protein